MTANLIVSFSSQVKPRTGVYRLGHAVIFELVHGLVPAPHAVNYRGIIIRRRLEESVCCPQSRRTTNSRRPSHDPPARDAVRNSKAHACCNHWSSRGARVVTCIQLITSVHARCASVALAKLKGTHYGSWSKSVIICNLQIQSILSSYYNRASHSTGCQLHQFNRLPCFLHATILKSTNNRITQEK